MKRLLSLGVVGGCLVALLGCGGSGGSGSSGGGSKPSVASVVSNTSSSATIFYKVTTQLNSGGVVTPESVDVKNGDSVELVITPETDFFISRVSGCNGQLNQDRYVLTNVVADCVVNIEFERKFLQGMKVYWQDATLPDGTAIRLASVSPDAYNLKIEDVRFSLVSHLQYLAMVDGLSFEASEASLRQYLNLYTGTLLSAISESIADQADNKFTQLKNETEVSVDSLIGLVLSDISEESPLEFRNRLKLEHEFSLSSDLIDLNNTNRTLTITSATSDEINPAYEVMWHSHSWNILEHTANTVVVEPTIVGDDEILFTLLDKADKSIKFSKNIPVKSIKTETIIPVLNEDTGELEITSGLSISKQGVASIPSEWRPTFYTDIGNGQLINLDVSGLSTETEFSFSYDPAIVPNPKLLQFSITKNNDEYLIQPSSIDFNNNVVRFIFNPSLSSSDSSQKQIATKNQQKQSASDTTTVHVKVSEKEPTGDDIDDLLDGKQYFIELAIAEMFRGVTTYKDPNKQINSYSDAKNKFALDYYSNNEAVKRIARAKLTKYLQVKDAKGYSRYKEFAAAINMAVAAQVLRDITWSNNGINKWFDKGCGKEIGNPSTTCVGFLNQAYSEGPELMNEGVSAFIGHSKLSSSQQVTVALFKAVANVTAFGAATGTPKSIYQYTDLAGSTGLAAFGTDTQGVIWALTSGGVQLAAGVAKSQVIVGLVASGSATGIGWLYDRSAEKANVRNYTPLIYALRENSKLLTKPIKGERFHEGWTLSEFKKDFLGDEFLLSDPKTGFLLSNKYSQLMQRIPNEPSDKWFTSSWGSRFGDVLDPGKRADTLLLNGDNASLPAEWYQDPSIAYDTRYAAIAFMIAAFGDKNSPSTAQYQSEITSIATQSLKLAVAPSLIVSQSIGISEVAGADFLIDPARDGSRPLIIKSKYRGDGGLVCELLWGAKYDNASSWKCKNGVQLQKSRNKLSKQSVSDTLSFENYKNIVGANELFDKLRLTVSPAGYKKLSLGSSIENIDIEVKGHKLNKNDGFVDLAERIGDYSKSSGLINANQFEYDPELELYYLPLGKVFPALKSSAYDNNLLAIGVTIKVDNGGVKKQGSHALVYSTLTDESLLVDDALLKERVRGSITDSTNNYKGIPNITVVLQPGNKITITDSNGYFDFGMISQGTYTISAAVPLLGAISTVPTDLVKISFDLSGADLEIEPEMVPIPGTTYSMSKYETTFDQYDAYVEETGAEKPSDSGWGRGNRPVINVSWDDAVAYAAWLSQKTGKNYRLPTADEWEFSARAGTTTSYFWGDDIGVNNANCLGCGSQWDGVSTAPVGSFKSNGFGLFDMHGNVLEWSSSVRCYDLVEFEWCGDRMLHGGFWGGSPVTLRSAVRIGNQPFARGNFFGFRLLRDSNYGVGEGELDCSDTSTPKDSEAGGREKSGPEITPAPETCDNQF